MNRLLPLLVLAFAFPSAAQEAVNLRTGGVIQAWYNAPERLPSSFTVRNARVFFTGDLSPNVSFNIMPAFMSPQGLTLLNAFIDLKPVDHLAFRVGQFVTPFGQNRMLPPAELELANFHTTSKIYPGFASDLGWDEGVQAGVTFPYVEARAAVVNGAGLNVSKDTDTFKDFTSRVDVLPLGNKDLVLGGSYYHGTSHGNGTVAPAFPGKRTWVGGHAKALYKGAVLQGEIISRSDDAQLWTVQGSYKFNLWRDWQLVAAYERFDPVAGHFARRLTGGLNFWVDKKTRLTLDAYGDNDGTTATKTVVGQVQVVF